MIDVYIFVIDIFFYNDPANDNKMFTGKEDNYCFAVIIYNECIMCGSETVSLISLKYRRVITQKKIKSSTRIIVRKKLHR